ncbi:hypothetical protein ACODYM_28935 [Burkholderia gladioli]|uniref:hypothetical protein n=1 Tax=Burkholderia gladioli TaxID=28095 RepID=UPI003B508B27
MLDLPHLSNAEFFRMHGTLPPARIEALLDVGDRLAEVKSVDAYIREGMAQLPAEDFLADVMSRLQDIAKRLRGANKEQLLGCVESLDDVAQTTFNAADYGRSELDKALKVCLQKS